MKNRILALTFIVAVVVISCTKDKTALPACPATISYQADILPVIQTSCSTSGCHDASAAGGYDLSTYAGVSSNTTNILAAIRQETGVTAMPLGAPKLADSIIDKFNCWVEQGALDN